METGKKERERKDAFPSSPPFPCLAFNSVHSLPPQFLKGDRRDFGRYLSSGVLSLSESLGGVFPGSGPGET